MYGFNHRVLVADRSGKVLSELDTRLGAVSWRLNGVGKATFEISVNDSKATQTNLQFGNHVLIEFDNGLPNWGGVIETPRSWNDDKTIGVTANSAEWLLALRTTDKGRYFTDSTVGEIFTAIIREANTIAPTGLEVGNVWADNVGHFPEYHFESLLNIVRDSICTRLSNADFAVLPTLDGGVITFHAHLYERRGVSKPNVVLIEGHNTSGEQLLEQGVIYTAIDVAGAGSGWGDDRLSARAESEAGIGLYGLRETSAIYGDVTSQSSLDEHAANLLAEMDQAKNMPALRALDLAPALFADYGTGDDVRVMLHSYGFGGFDKQCRIIAREFIPNLNEAALVLESV